MILRLTSIEKRYPLWKVFLVVLSFNIFLFALSYFLTQLAGEKNFNWAGYRDYLPNQVLGALATTLFFYGTLNYYHQLFADRKPAGYYILFTVVAFLSVVLYLFLIDYARPLENNKGEDQLNDGVLLFGYATVAFFNTGASLLIAYLNSLRAEKRKRQLLEAQKLQLEVEKMQANLNFLKAQINPHFLHNTLNSFYARAIPLSEELSEGILTLSHIMRYALSEDSTVEGKALLKDEVEHVRNVIRINQFRFRNSLQIHFEVSGVINGATIVPFVLITLVENIFKHGDLKDKEHPIEIRIKRDGDYLYYFSRNKKKKGPKELSTGIGLDNIKKRLDIAYGKEYSLHIRDENDFYTTELTIHLI